MRHKSPILLSLGSNRRGPWGEPAETLLAAIPRLQERGLIVIFRSSLYDTLPIGYIRQPRFLNMALTVWCDIPPAKLLHCLKCVERDAGRRFGRRWGPRTLDIDVIDYKGLILGKPTISRINRPSGSLVLPHPEAVRRGFVLVPVAEVAPGWRHPILRQSATAILRRWPRLRRGVTRRRLPAD